ncbi:MAG: hypothetical protein M3506_03445, partial [Chloroflexota bacterium]|nr:hypothetical protein [Chloroflexota bacterium]
MRSIRTGATVLALGLLMLGAWYVLGSGAANVESHGEQARLVPTRQVAEQRPTALPTALPTFPPEA